MAQVNVERKASEERERESSRNPERANQGLVRRSNLFSSFSPFISPSDFFTMNPFRLMRRLTDEMDRTFGQGFPAGEGGESAAWAPAIEVAHSDGKFLVRAELPGLRKDDVKVEVSGENIVIQGERRREHEEHKAGFYRSERSYGSFYRAIPLPEGANADQAKAQFENGILEVTIPAPDRPQASGRQIPIESGKQ